MERFFTPWRLEYLVGKREEGCIFCKKPLEKDRDRENLIVHQARHSFVILNRYPYNAGHLMVVPRRHTAEFESLSSDENQEMTMLLQRSISALKKAYRPEGFNMGLNLGQAGGAGIREHLHWHVVPRWSGDTNFLPIFSEVRVIPQYLADAWDLLEPLFKED